MATQKDGYNQMLLQRISSVTSAMGIAIRNY
jgi:hypothetical protein